MISGISRPIFSVLAFVAVLPHICGAIQCWEGSSNNSGIREPFFRIDCANKICVFANCTAGDFFFNEWTCFKDAAELNEKCGYLVKSRNQNEPLGNMGLTWTCECFWGDADKDFQFVPPWLESTTAPPESTTASPETATEMEETTAGVTDSAESKCFLSCFATITTTTILAIILPTTIANYGSLLNVNRMQ